MSVTFHKMHGAGNDFILLDLREQSFAIDADIARRLSDRHLGIGCDQILVLRTAQKANALAAFEVWNADGSRAEQCGNGVRCIGLYLKTRGEAPSGHIILSGPVEDISIECLDNDQVRVHMGKPSFDPDAIPILLPQTGDWYRLPMNHESITLGAVSMGNPHALMLVEDINTIDINDLGSFISQNGMFPNGCNAGFAQIIDRENIFLRVFERGAAETQACGSGACAAVSILRRSGLVDEKVNVTQAGGVLIIDWTGAEEPVIMTGPATHVFEGIVT